MDGCSSFGKKRNSSSLAWDQMDIRKMTGQNGYKKQDYLSYQQSATWWNRFLGLRLSSRSSEYENVSSVIITPDVKFTSYFNFTVKIYDVISKELADTIIYDISYNYTWIIQSDDTMDEIGLSLIHI